MEKVYYWLEGNEQPRRISQTRSWEESLKFSFQGDLMHDRPSHPTRQPELNERITRKNVSINPPPRQPSLYKDKFAVSNLFFLQTQSISSEAENKSSKLSTSFSICFNQKFRLKWSLEVSRHQKQFVVHNLLRLDRNSTHFAILIAFATHHRRKSQRRKSRTRKSNEPACYASNPSKKAMKHHRQPFSSSPSCSSSSATRNLIMIVDVFYTPSGDIHCLN